MRRTAQRPLPTGQVTPAEAIGFSTSCGALGLGLLGIGTTPATAMISAATIVTYAGVYTPLKVMTPYNTHLGAISGALPTLLGFTAALGGAGLAASPWLPHAMWLFSLQVFWQMPHFYALAWLYRKDYLRGGYNMFPLTDVKGHATAAMSKPYLVALCLMPWGFSACGLASWMLPIGALLPSAFWWQSLAAFEQKPNQATCRRFFLGSLSYLIAMLGLFTAFARPAGPQALSLEDVFCPVKKPKKDDTAEEEASQPRGPAWREKLYSWGVEACPHEQVKFDMFGIGKDSCPLKRDPF